MMQINRKQKSYLDELQNKYLKALNRYKLNQPLATSHRLILALQTIEKMNRQLIWRMGEYTFLVLNFLLNRLLRFPLLNISIGTYQVKLAWVLDLLSIQYQKQEKQLLTRRGISISVLLSAFALANRAYTVDWIISNEFRTFKWDELSDHELIEIAKFYSGNVNFEQELNYFLALKHLYFLLPVT